MFTFLAPMSQAPTTVLPNPVPAHKTPRSFASTALAASLWVV